MSLEPGSLIDDKYRVIRLIGEGGMGAVYHGENVRIRRQVAIKVLHAQVAQNAEVVQRFEREAQAAGCIGNDHILEVLDLGQLPNGDRYIVMEFLDGEALSHRLERLKRMSPADLSVILLQLLDGLGAAHRAGITHRDLKPDNIFLLKKKAGRQDFVKIIDFGISKFNNIDNGGLKMTRSGAVMGTPLYMSPEQARTAEADGRSDIYSVGVIMYEAVAGRVPFTAEQFNQLLIQIVMGDYVPLHLAAPDVDPHFAAIVTKAMALAREDRFQSTDEFRAALDEWRARAGLGRFSSVAPTMLAQTPAVGSLPGPGVWSAPRGSHPAVTPYPNPQATPYPNPQATPYPNPQATPAPGTPPHGVGGAQPQVIAGSSHAWGASQAGAPNATGSPAASRNRTLVAVAGALVALGVVAAVVSPRFMAHGGPAGVSAASSALPAPPSSALSAPAPAPLPATTSAEPTGLAPLPAPSAPSAPSAGDTAAEPATAPHPAAAEPPASPATPNRPAAAAGKAKTEVPRRPEATSPPSGAAKPNCNPPFVLDQKGEKHFKPECF
jgi:serine/threonine-protein kinase